MLRIRQLQQAAPAEGGVTVIQEDDDEGFFLDGLSTFQLVGFSVIALFVILWLSAVAYLVCGICRDRRKGKKRVHPVRSSSTTRTCGVLRSRGRICSA
jgi:hypothetical protein